MQTTSDSPRSGFEKFNDWRSNSLALKLFTISILVLLMLIPLEMIKSVIQERNYRKYEAEEEVGATWGGRQEINGPILTIPYVTSVYSTPQVDESGNRVPKVGPEIRYAHFLPESLQLISEVDPMVRKRGIYDILVYNGEVRISGEFVRPDFSGWPEVEKVLWESAFVSVGVTDMRAIRDQISLIWGSDSLEMSPGVDGAEVITSGVSTLLPGMSENVGTVPFTTELRLGGHSALTFVPLGKVTEATMTSTWSSPKFTGAFLPDPAPEVSKDGFSAHWKVLHLNRNFPQRFLHGSEDLSSAAFGTELLVMVDEYQQNERSAKYGILLVTLTFLMFFFTQALNKVRIHFVQYLLVGLALSMFYLLLLSFSEHIGFDFAYALGAAATTSLVVLYFKAITSSGRLSGILLFILAFVFTFIYLIIQMEDYALLAGSIGLFLILSTVMYLSRKVDWYAIGKKTQAE